MGIFLTSRKATVKEPTLLQPKPSLFIVEGRIEKNEITISKDSKKETYLISPRVKVKKGTKEGLLEFPLLKFL